MPQPTHLDAGPPIPPDHPPHRQPHVRQSQPSNWEVIALRPASGVTRVAESAGVLAVVVGLERRRAGLVLPLEAHHLRPLL